MGRHLGGRTVRRVGTAVLALALAGCQPAFEIVSPTPGGQVPENGQLSVEVDLGDALPDGSSVSAYLLSVPVGGGVHKSDVSDHMVSQRGASGENLLRGTLGPAEGIAPGANLLVVNVRRGPDGDPEVAARMVVWAPGIDLASIAASHPDRCDPIEQGTCLYPFPNDWFTRADPTTDTGRRVALQLDSMPASVHGVRVDPSEWNRNDGFSPGAMIVTRIPGIDLGQTGAPTIANLAHSLDADSPFALVDAATGERQLFFAELDVHAKPLATQTLILRPGRNLQDGHRYVVGLARPRDAAGQPIQASPAFRLYRDGIGTLIPEIEARRPQMEHAFELLAGVGLAREDLVQAWEFTVISKRSMSERMIHMRDDAFASLAGGAPSFQVTQVYDDWSPTILRRVDGTFQVPLYLDNDGKPGSRLLYDVPTGQPLLDQLPIRAGGGTATYTAQFRCIVPRSASADGTTADAPARISLYGHGLLGSHTETSASHVEAMAFEHDIVFCGTDSIGMAEDDYEVQPGYDAPWVAYILNDMSLFPTLADRLHQGLLNTLFLGRLMIHPDGLASDPAFRGSQDDQSFIDGSHLFYDGNSQGGIFGGAIAAYSTDLHRAVLGVPGMNYSTLLRRSRDFDQFLLLLTLNYAQREHSLLISLIQMLWDRVETSGNANHLTRDPYPGTPPKTILMHVAWGDFQVANITAEIEARTIGAAIHRPAIVPESRHWEAEPFYGLPTIQYPSDGSAMIYWDSGNLTPPSVNDPPTELGDMLGPCPLRYDGDPHECPRREPAARLQKSEFLREDVDEDGDGTPDRDGRVINVCGEDGGGGLLPCLAPGT